MNHFIVPRAIGLFAAALIVGTLAAPTAAAQPDPCTLLPAAEVSSALGTEPSGGKADPPRKESGATGRLCTQQIGKRILSINVAEFASAPAADQGFTLVLKQFQDNSPEMKLAPATGVGDRSAFGTRPMGAMWMATKGKYMLAITVMLEPTNPSQLREPIRRLMMVGLAKLAP
jgi:hypothetical protein